MPENSRPSLASENVPETTKASSEEEQEENSKEENIEVNIDSLLKLHNINLELPVGCDFCPETFMDLDVFDEHMAQHSECRFFSCQLCTNTYVSWGNLVAHRKVCHRSEVISCDTCSQRKHHLNLGPLNFPVGEFPIGCEECKKGFHTVIDLYKHYRVHTRYYGHSQEETLVTKKSAQRKFGCPVCGAQFFTMDQLQAHLALLKEDDTSYQCQVCPMRFCTVQSLAMHKRTHPVPKVIKPIVCPTCGKVLRGPSTYYRHKMIHTGERPYRCNWCPKSFTRKSALDLHKYSHPITEDYSCFNCKLSYKELEELEEHVKKDHDPEKQSTLTCGVCKEECPIDNFLIHYVKCHIAREDKAALLRRETITCTVCKKVFSQPTALARHMKLHDVAAKPSYKCEECNVVLSRRPQFLAHLRTHFGSDGEFPEQYQKILKEFQQIQKNRRAQSKMSFICEYCGREFHKKMSLQLHVRRHTGERPHLCQLCGKSFYTRQQLSVHVRQHTGERPYQCTICHKAFTGPTTLYMHRKLHKTKNPYKCQHCSREFSWRSTYIGHLRLHTGERPYKCTLCPKAFTLKGKLNLHMKKHGEDHVIHTCENCGEHFGSMKELISHEKEQSCCSIVTIIEGQNETDEYIVLEGDIPEDQVFVV